MAGINSTENSRPNESIIGLEEKITMYEKYPQEYRFYSALKTANALRDKQEKMCVLVDSIVQRLTPLDGSDSKEFHALKLTEILADIVNDTSDGNDLIACLLVAEKSFMSQSNVN